MALKNITKNTTFGGTSVIVSGDKSDTVETYSATVNSAKPENVNFSSYIQNQALYKANRTQCRKDRAEFEDMVYAAVDEMASDVDAAVGK